MTDSWDDIGFLARSKHRFRILEALSERPYERDELQQETDVSRTTIQRTLSDMEEKGWIENAGWRYKLTELGDIIRSEFDRVLGVAGAVQELNQVIEWVPVEAIDIDLHYFRDATISVASRNDPTLPVREYANLLSTDGHVRGLIYGLDSFGLAEHKRILEETDQQYEGVFSAGLYDQIRANPRIAEETAQVVGSEQTEFYRYGEELPFHIVLTSDAVGLLLTSADGTFSAFIESRNETVISWAEEKYDWYRERSRPVAVTDLTSDNRQVD